MRAGKRMKNVLASAAVVAVAALAAWAWQQRTPAEPPAAEASLVAAEVRTLEVIVEAAGKVEPVQVVEVKSNASGQVLAVHAETGDQVAAGTLLAEIDPRDVQSALDQAAADLEAAQVRRSAADAERRRAERLLAEGLLAEQEVEATVEAAAAARAAAIRAETTLRLAREKRQDTTIRAPIAGTLIERTVEAGGIVASATSNVSGGSTLFRMADLSRMQVRANVDEVDIGRLQPGQAARVTVESYPDRAFAGTVAKIEPQAVVEQNVTMFPVLVRLDNPGGLLRPGMNAELSVEVARRADVVAVPNAAVVSVREARAAAELLGVDLAAARPAGPAGAAGGPAATPAAGAGAASADACRELLARLRAGGGPAGLDEAERERLRACREELGAGRGGGGRGARGRDGTADGAAGGGGRPAVVFVRGPRGDEARRVVVGLSDWEHTEVVAGLAAGEQVVLVSVAQLQRRQQELSERMRQRFSGPLGQGSSGRGGQGAARGGQGAAAGRP
jgi:HlyD family secretion protein